jgi:citrate synthase
VYEGADPRVAVLLDAVAAAKAPAAILRTAAEVVALVTADRGPQPNVDFALGVLGEAMRMDPGAGEAIFAVARCAGWIAHGLEEYQHRLRYRIRATYTGPDSHP